MKRGDHTKVKVTFHVSTRDACRLIRVAMGAIPVYTPVTIDPSSDRILRLLARQQMTSSNWTFSSVRRARRKMGTKMGA